MKITLFVGAGASVFASQPTTKDLLALLRDRVRKRKNDPNRNSALQAYAERIVGAKEYGDVENLYDGLQAMIDIHDNPNRKPISEEIHPQSSEEEYVLTHEEVSNELKELQSTIREILLDSFKITSDIRESIGEVYDMVRSVIEKNGVGKFQVFTSNYDQVIETYAKEKGLEIINGFGPPVGLAKEWSGVWRRNTDKPPLYLTKLHGSIHWHRNDGVIVETGAIALRDIENDVMVFPTEDAKRHDGKPFSTLTGRFKDVLQDTDVLLVIGFSYRDDEIVRLIKDRVAEGMALISVSPDATRDIHRVSGADVEIRGSNAGTGLSVVTNSRIVLYEQLFGPHTINDVRTALERACELVSQHEDGNAVT